MNIEEIAHAMVTMSVNEKDRRRMGEAGYRRVNAFYRIDQMKEVYREIYKGFSDRQNLSWTEEPFQIIDTFDFSKCISGLTFEHDKKIPFFFKAKSCKLIYVL